MPALPHLAFTALLAAQPTPGGPPATASPTTSTTSTSAPSLESDVGAIVGAIVDGSRQLVVVQTNSWGDTVGRLQRYAREADGWQAVGPAVDVVVGASGLGWGVGLHGGGVGVDAPRKVEGDERAPAGVFRLTRVFGKVKAPASGLPALAIADGDVCVDDVTHPTYNRILPAEVAAVTAPPWKSAETLRRKDWLYDLLVVVDQNHAEGEGVVAGRGSCVFLHVWRAEKRPTAGCTAMEKAQLEDLIRWLQQADAPLLVQLPRPVYAQVRGTWRLP